MIMINPIGEHHQWLAMGWTIVVMLSENPTLTIKAGGE